MTPDEHRVAAQHYATDALGYLIRGDTDTAREKHQAARIHLIAAMNIEAVRKREISKGAGNGIETEAAQEALQPEAASSDDPGRAPRSVENDR
ncbi:hypothetical protein HW532_15790 [Kaustia mangrovi]|uniref:Uncharacterized protein n=1 Tax=Kaustia mangrovi TaxID=2593653 RepID=A0A7S8HD13_9HYPH|nr:hypothetical protein [Kaustia mangrovi]QPC44024.1 hypothetical protein HW532_15790 [Kaustia mangrovi]